MLRGQVASLNASQILLPTSYPSFHVNSRLPSFSCMNLHLPSQFPSSSPPALLNPHVSPCLVSGILHILFPCFFSLPHPPIAYLVPWILLHSLFPECHPSSFSHADKFRQLFTVLLTKHWSWWIEGCHPYLSPALKCKPQRTGSKSVFCIIPRTSTAPGLQEMLTEYVFGGSINYFLA